MQTERMRHWDRLWTEKASDQVSWFQAEPQMSLELIEATEIPPEAPILDVGGGASRLVDSLLEIGFGNVTVLDVSAVALQRAKQRLGQRANAATWIVGDITRIDLAGTFDLWHDRAVFHFLVEDDERKHYVETLKHSLSADGHVILGTFALDGPATCSGLPVARYDPDRLLAVFGRGFALQETRHETHVTPTGQHQRYAWFRLRRQEET